MRRNLILALCGALLPAAALAQQPPDPRLPGELREVGFEQRLGEQVPLDAPFVDEDGRSVVLGDLMGERPVVLALVYYECPMICTMVLTGLTSSLKVLDFEAGDEYEVIVLSFDPGEGPALAKAKKAAYVEEFGRELDESAWHYLTGEEESIARVCEAIGFRYSYDSSADQFAHATGITVLTPEGQISRYLFGIEYAPKDLKLAVVESSEGKIGGVVEQLLLFCYQYDPASGRYGAAVMNLIRAAAGATVLAIALFIFLARRRNRAPAGSVRPT